MLVSWVEPVDSEDYIPGTVLGTSDPFSLDLLHNSQKMVGAAEVQRGATPRPGLQSC